MPEPDRDTTQDWLIPEMRTSAVPALAPFEAEEPSRDAPEPASAPAGNRVVHQIAAVAASADAAGALAEAAAASAQRARDQAEQGSRRADQALERAEEVAGRLDQALAALEADERTRIHRAGEVDGDPDPLRRFEARADRVAQRLRDLERRRSPHRIARPLR